MKRMLYPFTAAMLAGVAATTVPLLAEDVKPESAKPATTDSRPNIIFMFTDDHATAAISAYGSVINKTPFLDKLATQGIRFDSVFCTNAICTPSRACILTGQFSHRTGVTTLDTKLDNNIPTFASALTNAGYQTAVFGKWHLGESAQNLPKNFTHFEVYINQGEYYNPRVITPETLAKQIEAKKAGKNAPSFTTLNGYATDLNTSRSLAWLDQRDKNKPFMLLLHHKAPHRNWIPAKKYEQLFDGENLPIPPTLHDNYVGRLAAKHARMRIDQLRPDLDLKLPAPPHNVNADLWMYNTYIAPENPQEKLDAEQYKKLREWKYQRYIKNYLRCVQSVDDSMGEVMAWLEKNNLAENTVVIYSSDQGFFLGEMGMYDKRLMYEPALRMPFILRYPKLTGDVGDGRANKDIITNVDFARTLLDLAEVSAPDTMQGRSFKEIIAGNTPSDWTKSAYYRYWMSNDAEHKVLGHYGVRTDRYKLIYFYNEPLGQRGAGDGQGIAPFWEFYDLEKDPNEQHNAINDPENQELIQRLKAELERQQQAIGDTPRHQTTAVMIEGWK